jgi:hypothetical protein
MGSDQHFPHLSFRLRVESYSGYRGEEEPRAFTLGERRFAVQEILDRWLEPRHRYFKVRADDGRTFILRHDIVDDAWELAALVGEKTLANRPEKLI